MLVVLLVFVLVVMQVARRPDTWVSLFPAEHQPVENGPVERARAEKPSADDAPRSAPPARRADPDQPLIMGALILLGAAYFAWRVVRVGRSFWKPARPRPEREGMWLKPAEQKGTPWWERSARDEKPPIVAPDRRLETPPEPQDTIVPNSDVPSAEIADSPASAAPEARHDDAASPPGTENR
jgi:hypothetical protein